MKYKTEKDLKEVYSFINEAELALSDKTRTINDSKYKEAIAAGAMASGVAGAGVAAAMAAGMLTPLAPIVIIGGLTGLIGRLIKKNRNEKKIRDAKVFAYKQAIEKQNAIIKALKEETDADKERIEYLIGINQLLQQSSIELQNELKQYQ